MRLCVNYDRVSPAPALLAPQEFFMEVRPGLTYAQYLRQAEIEAQAWDYPHAIRLTWVVLFNDRYIHIATLLKEN